MVQQGDDPLGRGRREGGQAGSEPSQAERVGAVDDLALRAEKVTAAVRDGLVR